MFVTAVPFARLMARRNSSAPGALRPEPAGAAP
jgi:hypothetical protein